MVSGKQAAMHAAAHVPKHDALCPATLVPVDTAPGLLLEVMVMVAAPFWFHVPPPLPSKDTPEWGKEPTGW